MQWIFVLCLVVVGFLSAATTGAAATPSRPNIVFLLADDLGYGDLGCYGQQKFSTPNIDRLAAEGMRLTVHYSGSPVCAPSRCVLMTGRHTGHGYIRENRQHQPGGEGQWPVPAGELTLPLTLRRLGYAVGGFGKWGLGAPGTTGEPLRQGFTRFFGYNCQAVAHNYYPTHLWDDGIRFALDNPPFPAHQRFPTNADPADPAAFARYAGRQFAPDLINEQARRFVRENRDRPFFLYYATTVPHLALQVPEDSLAEFAGRFPEEPYLGDRSYLPHRTPRAAYAAMVTRLDREIGRLLDLLRELDLERNSIVVFTSDNGPLYDRLGGTDTDFFRSAGPFRGRKGGVLEGGMRVPCLIRWPGHIQAGSASARVTGFEDWLPTLLELAGARRETPHDTDGISFAPTLAGKRQRPRTFLYRETPGYGGQQCVREGDWKAVRRNLNPAPGQPDRVPGAFELYDLARDPAEAADVAKKHPDIVQRLADRLRAEHRTSGVWPMSALDGAAPRAR